MLGLKAISIIWIAFHYTKENCEKYYKKQPSNKHKNNKLLNYEKMKEMTFICNVKVFKVN